MEHLKESMFIASFHFLIPHHQNHLAFHKSILTHHIEQKIVKIKYQNLDF